MMKLMEVITFESKYKEKQKKTKKMKMHMRMMISTDPNYKILNKNINQFPFINNNLSCSQFTQLIKMLLIILEKVYQRMVLFF